MATLIKDTVGVLDIELIQGDDKTVTLAFSTVNLAEQTVPLDLRQYSAIRLDVKSAKDVNERPFFSFTLGNGLTVSGEDFNVLTFSFTTQFVATAQTSWFYDIKFTSVEGVKHLIEGSINVQKTVTK